MKWQFVLAILILIASCNKQEKSNYIYVNTDSIQGIIIADTIVYDVIIKNTNPEDLWSEECLKNLDQRSLVDNIFTNIYSEEMIAFNYLSNDTISIDMVKQIEKESWFSREAIGKIQFAEIWFYNTEHQVMNKEVVSIILGVEQFDELGELKGYKPLFKVYMN